MEQWIVDGESVEAADTRVAVAGGAVLVESGPLGSRRVQAESGGGGWSVLVDERPHDPEAALEACRELLREASTGGESSKRWMLMKAADCLEEALGILRLGVVQPEPGPVEPVPLSGSEIGYLLMCVRLKLRKDERTLARGKGGEGCARRVDQGRTMNTKLRSSRRELKGKG